MNDIPRNQPFSVKKYMKLGFSPLIYTSHQYFPTFFYFAPVSVAKWANRLSAQQYRAYLADDLQSPGIKSGSRHVGRLD